MNKKLQDVVASQYEASGFKFIAGEIRKCNGVTDVRKVVMQVISKLTALDPSGFGQDIQDISTKGDSAHGKSKQNNN
jgi:hypothetical protein